MDHLPKHTRTHCHPCRCPTLTSQKTPPKKKNTHIATSADDRRNKRVVEVSLFNKARMYIFQQVREVNYTIKCLQIIKSKCLLT